MPRKFLFWFASILVISLLAVFVARFLLGGEEDAWLCQNGAWAKHGNPSAPMPTSGCGESAPAEQILPTSGNPDLIKVDSPWPGEYITSPVKVSGRAKGNWFFEASFPLVLVDWDGKIIAQGHAEARSDWMTQDYVPFEAEFSFTRPDYGDSSDQQPFNRGALILKKDNPSDLPQNDDAVEIPIYFE